MRILHVIPGLTRERGGPSAVLEGLTRHQARAGHAVAVLTTNQGLRHGEQAVALDDSVEVERIEVRGSDRWAFAPGFARSLRAHMRSSDLVHIHSIFNYPAHVALREALAVQVPTVFRPCGQLHRYSLRRSRWRKWAYLKLWGRMVRRACGAWHYTSENEAAESWPWDASPRFVLPNGIEPDDYAIGRTEACAVVGKRWPQIGDSPYVLFLGRLHPKKRVDLLLEAFLTGAPSEFKLVVAGPDERNLWSSLTGRFLRDAVAGRRVLRLGTVGGSEKIALLAAATLFALPSEHENFGNAVLEALAAGTPVLLSPHVDLAAAAVAAGFASTALLDPVAWGHRLATLLTDRVSLESMADQAKQWVHDQYSWSSIASRLELHYQRLLGTATLASAAF